MLDGIVTYFDFTLFDHLLYAPEKKQYEVILDKKVCVVTPDHGQQSSEHTPVECCEKVELPSRIYGVEHLLRLFGMIILLFGYVTIVYMLPLCVTGSTLLKTKYL